MHINLLLRRRFRCEKCIMEHLHFSRILITRIQTQSQIDTHLHLCSRCRNYLRQRECVLFQRQYWPSVNTIDRVYDAYKLNQQRLQIYIIPHNLTIWPALIEQYNLTQTNNINLPNPCQLRHLNLCLAKEPTRMNKHPNWKKQVN